MISLWLDKIRSSCPFNCLLHPFRRLFRKLVPNWRVNRLIFSNLCLKILDDLLLKERNLVAWFGPLVVLEVDCSVLVRWKVQANGNILSVNYRMYSSLAATLLLLILLPPPKRSWRTTTTGGRFGTSSPSARITFNDFRSFAGRTWRRR